MNTKYLYINTIGCQMNVYDSELMEKILKPLGYKITTKIELADLIIMNTCSIREKAQQKVFSFLGRVSNLKAKKKGLIICVGGCVAQQEGNKLLKRFSYLDLVFGTHAISNLGTLIKEIEKKRCRLVDIKMNNSQIEPPSDYKLENKSKVTDFVTIMRGCDNYCSYCVVPYTRGREQSRNPESIIKEIKKLVQNGLREITLLGQNVNSYGKKDGLCSFVELLTMINDIDDLLRIRFVTSHPKDLSDDLIMTFKTLEKQCNNIHLPVQAGSNKILKSMNRKYTKESYIEKIEKLRNICPDIAISTDIIVGFPQETQQDFYETIDLMKEVEFDHIYAFIYSDRPNAIASSFSDKVKKQSKKDRLQEVLELQEFYTIKKNKTLIGGVEKVLVEGFSKKNCLDNKCENQDNQWVGRTTTNKIVNFEISNQEKQYSSGRKIVIGDIVDINIEKAFTHSLWGRFIAKAGSKNW